MQVKCLLVVGNEARLSMAELMGLAHGHRGKQSFTELVNYDPGENAISLVEGAGALFMTGGRDSIQSFLVTQQSMRIGIVGLRPFRASFMRKKRTLGKNETCVKIVSGMGHNSPEDGTPYQDLGLYSASGGPFLRIQPMDLNHSLNALYGWG